MSTLKKTTMKEQVYDLIKGRILDQTYGFGDKINMLELSQELTEVGVVDLDLTGTTLNQVDYGSPILLVIHGKISGQMAVTGNGLFRTVFGETYYEFEERRMSTAKN